MVLRLERPSKGTHTLMILCQNSVGQMLICCNLDSHNKNEQSQNTGSFSSSPLGTSSLKTVKATYIYIQKHVQKHFTRSLHTASPHFIRLLLTQIEHSQPKKAWCRRLTTSNTTIEAICQCFLTETVVYNFLKELWQWPCKYLLAASAQKHPAEHPLQGNQLAMKPSAVDWDQLSPACTPFLRPNASISSIRISIHANSR